ncbi:MAG: peptidylprolyl isomerase [Verrucomicrobiales bacterium]
MSVQKKMAIRMGIYVLLVGYLLMDLFVFNGPIKTKLTGPEPDSPEAIAAAKAQGIVARVYAQPIYRAQVEERVVRMLTERGRQAENVSEAEHKLLRQVALRDLIDERLVKVQIKVSATDQYPVSEEERAAALTRFKQRFGDEEALAQALAAQGWEGEKELSYRLAARLQRERYLTQEIGGQASVSDEEIIAWYEENKEALTIPARRKMRHIFIAALDHEADAGRELIESAHQRLTAGKEDFAKLAAELSEDLRSKKQGGELGWLTPERLPGDFAAAAFELKAQSPTIIETKLGWHLVEVTELAAARPQSLEEVREEIRLALQWQKREEKIPGFRQLLRHWAGDKVEVFQDVLHAELTPPAAEENAES